MLLLSFDFLKTTRTNSHTQKKDRVAKGKMTMAPAPQPPTSSSSDNGTRSRNEDEFTSSSPSSSLCQAATTTTTTVVPPLPPRLKSNKWSRMDPVAKWTTLLDIGRAARVGLLDPLPSASSTNTNTFPTTHPVGGAVPSSSSWLAPHTSSGLWWWSWLPTSVRRIVCSRRAQPRPNKLPPLRQLPYASRLRLALSLLMWVRCLRDVQDTIARLKLPSPPTARLPKDGTLVVFAYPSRIEERHVDPHSSLFLLLRETHNATGEQSAAPHMWSPETGVDELVLIENTVFYSDQLERRDQKRFRNVQERLRGAQQIPYVLSSAEDGSEGSPLLLRDEEAAAAAHERLPSSGAGGSGRMSRGGRIRRASAVPSSLQASTSSSSSSTVKGPSPSRDGSPPLAQSERVSETTLASLRNDVSSPVWGEDLLEAKRAVRQQCVTKSIASYQFLAPVQQPQPSEGGTIATESGGGGGGRKRRRNRDEERWHPAVVRPSDELRREGCPLDERTGAIHSSWISLMVPSPPPPSQEHYDARFTTSSPSPSDVVRRLVHAHSTILSSLYIEGRTAHVATNDALLHDYVTLLFGPLIAKGFVSLTDINNQRNNDSVVKTTTKAVEADKSKDDDARHPSSLTSSSFDPPPYVWLLCQDGASPSWSKPCKQHAVELLQRQLAALPSASSSSGRGHLTMIHVVPDPSTTASVGCAPSSYDWLLNELECTATTSTTTSSIHETSSRIPPPPRRRVSLTTVTESQLHELLRTYAVTSSGRIAVLDPSVSYPSLSQSLQKATDHGSTTMGLPTSLRRLLTETLMPSGMRIVAVNAAVEDVQGYFPQASIERGVMGNALRYYHVDASILVRCLSVPFSFHAVTTLSLSAREAEQAQRRWGRLTSDPRTNVAGAVVKEKKKHEEEREDEGAEQALLLERAAMFLSEPSSRWAKYSLWAAKLFRF